MVAARYSRQQYLIGPDLYSIYAFAVAIVLACIALAAAISGVVATAVNGGYVGRGIGALMKIIWSGAFTGIGVVTMIFFILQRTGVSQGSRSTGASATCHASPGVVRASPGTSALPASPSLACSVSGGWA